MINALSKIFTFLYLNLISIFILLNFTNLYSQNKISDTLIGSYANKFMFETGKINFQGNITFSNSDLQSIISSRETNRSWEHKIYLYYAIEMKKPVAVPIIPSMLIKSLDAALATMINEINFFDQNRADNDALTLQDFYNQNGFHKARVYYIFEPNRSKNVNELTFYINEDTSSIISSIIYLGLDSLPPDLNNSIKLMMVVKAGERFNENKIFSEVKGIQFKLLDNGFYYTRFDIPLVLKDTIKHTDSVLISFHTGKRQRIAGINYIDSTKGQNLVIDNMKERQLEFVTGDWYSLSNVNRSINNLLSLGTFDIVNIDTSSKFKRQTDSTLSMIVFTQYRKQQEWGLGLYINRTSFDNFTNAGLEATYFHRNIGGIAQNLNIFGRGEVHDISRWTPPDFQIQAGVSLAQPLIFIIDKARFGFTWQLLYSYTNIFSDVFSSLRLSNISMPFKFPVKFLDITFFQNGSVDFFIERQVPLNYEEAYNKTLERATNNDEREKIKSSFKLYESLNRYRHKTGMLVPTAVIFSISGIGDKRDDMFNPSGGYNVNLSTDFTIPRVGIAEFLRAQLSYYFFTRLSPTTIFALKVRGGYTYWYDQGNSYVPFERQFFAGGANSVRGWSSRRLRFPQPDTSKFATGTLDFFQDFVGSGAILEGSFELRFRFLKPRGFGAFWSDIISNIVLTSFIDWGNTFHWYSDYNYPYKWYDYFTKLAVAGGAGIGYLTPVGPIRVDLALPFYDPSAAGIKTIFNRLDVLNDLKIHIGLGYSF